jgi:hypothetical protein
MAPAVVVCVQLETRVILRRNWPAFLIAALVWCSSATLSSAQVRVLIEASRDGGGWWFPQGGPFNPNLPHQGKAFADFLRARGIDVTEVARPRTVTCALLTQFDLVVVTDIFNLPAWSPGELDAYNRFVRNGGRLIYLTDYKRESDFFPLAASLGLQFSGETGIRNVTQFAPHPITAGVSSLSYVAGSFVTAAPPSATMLAFLDGAPVMGVTPLGAGVLFFLGDVNGIQQGPRGLPERLVGNLVSFMLNGATRADRCGSSEGLPGATTGLRGVVSGSTLTLNWTAPLSGAVTSYALEAGRSAGDSSVASFDTGTNATSLFAAFVPPGTYFIRVKARNSLGEGPASNEVVIQVGASCGVAPQAPRNTVATVVGRTVTLTWAAPPGPLVEYVVQAGAAPGASNLANFSTGTSATSLIASAPPGTYFVRIRARNACGTSEASNEIVITIP